jgi:hypothetical protein
MIDKCKNLKKLSIENRFVFENITSEQLKRIKPQPRVENLTLNINSSLVNEDFLSYVQLKFTNLKYFSLRGQISSDDSYNISSDASLNFTNDVLAIPKYRIEGFVFQEWWREEPWLISQVWKLPFIYLVVKKLEITLTLGLV